MAAILRKLVAGVTMAAFAAQPLCAYPQVVPDASAPGALRPLVESTANGLPLVQITAPSPAGVSRNQYLHYNVDPQGLILNNAVTIAKTQQGGYIDGNPFLGGGAARVILNEVTGGDLSRLRGFTEVAGQRAEVVIANPMGITCDGCGFINTSRGVLTTGTPVIAADGSLSALNVTRGLISVEGRGFNGADTDRVDLISRAVRVNADLWASQLNVVTGANRVEYASLAPQRIAGEGPAPGVSIDVAALGGMYANRIRLIGTEAGVGVNSRGTLAALQGDFTVTTDGRVVLSGRTSAAGGAELDAAQGISNAGAFYGQGDVRIASAGAVENAGSLAAGGGVNVSGASIAHVGTMAAGVSADGVLAAPRELTLSARGLLQATGTTASAGALALRGSAIDARGGSILAGSVSLRADAGDVDAAGATLDVQGRLDVSAAGALRHDAAVTIAGSVDVETGSLLNRGGYIGHAGTDAARITVSGAIDNTDGVIASNGTDASFRAGQIVNTRGRIEHAGAGTLAIAAAGRFDNDVGIAASNGAIDLRSASFGNGGGAVVALGDASVAVAGDLGNAAGEVRAFGALNVAAGGVIDNRGGGIEAGGPASVEAASLDNRSGRVAAVGSQPMTVRVAGTLDNSQGLLGGNGDVDLAAGDLANRAGEMVAASALTVRGAGDLDNTGGRIASGTALSLRQPGTVANEAGAIETGGSLALETGALTNAGGAVTAGIDASLAAGAVANDGGLIAAARDASLSASALAGDGTIGAGRDLRVSIAGDYAHSPGTALETGRDLSLAVTGQLTNDGQLRAPRRLDIGAGAMANGAGASVAAADTAIDVAGTLANFGRIEGDDVAVRAAAASNSATIVGDRVTVSGGSLTNEGAAALIGATERLALFVPGQLTNRDGASLYSLGDMTIAGAPDRGADGRFLVPTGQLLNESAYIEADRALEIAAAEIVNRRTSLSTATQTISSSSRSLTGYPGWTVITESYDNESGTRTFDITPVTTAITKTVAAGDVLEDDTANRRLVFKDVKQEIVNEYVCEGSSDGDFCGTRTRIADVPTVTTAYYESLALTDDGYSVHFYPGYDPNLHIPPGTQIAVAINGRVHNEIARVIDEVTTEDRVIGGTPEPRIASGTDMRLDVRGALQNEFGLVAAGGSLSVDADKVANVGRDLLRTDTRNRTSIVFWNDPCGFLEKDCGQSVFAWPLPPEVTTSVVGSVRGVVAANQSISIAARSVDNISVAAAASPVGGLGSTSVLPTASAAPGARSVDPLGGDFRLPTGGLFRVSPPNPNYVIETDPRFADYRTFISSDYMLSRLALDPAATTKRLGDGLYEAQLVREEIYRLTGQRFLTAYYSDTEQFQALMDNGIAFAQALRLSPGVALSAEQMVALTHDIVWLEQRDVALPDGRVERVLVPVVYLAATDPGDLQSSGALLAANDLVLRTTDAITNSGVIRGGERAALAAGSVQNVGGTIASGGLTQVETAGDVVNRSGVIRGVDVTVLAGRDLRNETAVQQVAAGNAAIGASSTLLSRRGSIAAERDAMVAAGRDVVLSGAEVRAGGDAAIGAAGSVTLDTVETSRSRQLYAGSSHSVMQSATQLGASVGAGNDVSIGAQQDIALTAAGVSAGRDLILEAGGNIAVGAARNTSGVDVESRGSKGTYGIVRTYDETVAGSSLEAGRDVALSAGASSVASGAGASGSIAITGSRIGSETGAIALAAPGDVTVQAQSERHTSFAESLSKSNSVLSKKSTEQRNASDETVARSSTISGESVSVASGGSVTVAGSNVVATGDVAIAAREGATITTAAQTRATESYRYEKKSGVFGSGGFGLTVGQQSTKSTETEDSLTNLGSTVGSAQGRATVVAGGDYRQTGSEVLAPAGIDISARNVAIDAAQDTTHTTYAYERKQSGLTVSLSGGVVSPLVTAQDSLNRGNDVQDDRLKAVYAYRAGRNVYEAGEQAAAAMSGTKSFFEVQVSVGSSEQKMDAQSQSTRAVGSTVASDGDVAITAAGGASGGGDLAVAGSAVSGRNVALAAANALSLRSAANTYATQSTESGKSGAVGAGFGVGAGGAGISVFASGSRASGNTSGAGTAWTETQVTAGGTLTLRSGGDAELIGAQARGERIEAAIGGSLTVQSQQDLDTYHRDTRQSGASVGYTFGAGTVSGSASSLQSKTDSDYASVVEQTGLFAGTGGFDVDVQGNTDLQGAVLASQAAPEKNRLATGTLSFGNIANQAEYSASSSGGAIGFGGGNLPLPTPVLGVSGGEDAASTTLAAVAPGTLEIRNPDAQRQDVAALSRDPATSHQALGRIFDAQTVADQQELAQLFGQEAFRAVGDIANLFTKPYEQAKADETLARSYQELLAKTEPSRDEQSALATFALLGYTPENVDQKLDAALRQQELTRADYEAWQEGSLNKTLLHTFVGALQANLGGADTLSGALGAGAAEASRTLTEQLPKELQQWASAAVGAAAGAMAGNGSAGVQTGAATAWSGEVYNRQLHPKETDWITQNARRFAEEQGITEEQAKTRLALQAAKDVDFLWRSALAPGDDAAARKFLGEAEGTFVNERGNAQRLFTTELGQYFAFQQGVFDVDKQFYRSQLTPNAQRNITQGALAEAKRFGGQAWDAATNDPLGVGGAIVSGLYESGKSLILDLGGAVVGAYDRFMATGQDMGTGYGAALDPALRDPLNELYGQDVSGAVAIATTANVTATVASVFGAGKVAGIAGDVAVQGVTRITVARASNLLKAPFKSEETNPIAVLSYIASNARPYSAGIVGAKVEGIFDYAHPGSLPDKHAINFAGQRYEEVILTQQTTFPRSYGGNAGPIGREGTYVSIDPQFGGLQSAIDYAVDPAWGNTGSRISAIVVPAGTKVYVGPAANQGGVWVGGKTQVYIPPGVNLEVK